MVRDRRISISCFLVRHRYGLFTRFGSNQDYMRPIIIHAKPVNKLHIKIYY